MKCRYENCSDHKKELFVKVPRACWSQTVQFISRHTPHIGWSSFSPTGLNPWSSPWVPDLAQWNPNYPWKAVSPTQMQPMVLEYLPIFTPKIAQLCRQIFHTWSIRARYKLVLLQLLTDAKCREFSGMIHFITINFIIPATPSNPSSNPA